MQNEGQVVTRRVRGDLLENFQEVNPVVVLEFWKKDLAVLVYESGEF
jgi:hypothetical protein